MLRDLTDREITRIGSEGTVELALALVVEPLAVTLLAWFEGVIPWSGAPFCWHRLPTHQRWLPPLLAEGEEAPLTFVLVEGRDGTIRAVRTVTLGRVRAGASRRHPHQAARPFAEREDQRQLDLLAELWKAGGLVERACAVWNSHRPGTWGG